jgi:hypothetical protein
MVDGAAEQRVRAAGHADMRPNGLNWATPGRADQGERTIDRTTVQVILRDCVINVALGAPFKFAGLIS